MTTRSPPPVADERDGEPALRALRPRTGRPRASRREDRAARRRHLRDAEQQRRRRAAPPQPAAGSAAMRSASTGSPGRSARAREPSARRSADRRSAAAAPSRRSGRVAVRTATDGTGRALAGRGSTFFRSRAAATICLVRENAVTGRVERAAGDRRVGADVSADTSIGDVRRQLLDREQRAEVVRDGVEAAACTSRAPVSSAVRWCRT